MSIWSTPENEAVWSTLGRSRSDGKTRGFQGWGILSADEADGFTQSLRETDQQNAAAKRDIPPTGQTTVGYTPSNSMVPINIPFGQIDDQCNLYFSAPPGLVPTPITTSDEVSSDVASGDLPGIDSDPTEWTPVCSTHAPNEFDGVIPTDVDHFDFAQMEDGMRSVLFWA